MNHKRYLLEYVRESKNTTEEGKERLEDLHKRLCRLNARQAKAIRLVYFEQRLMKDAAKEMGMTDRGLRKMLSRIIGILSA